MSRASSLLFAAALAAGGASAEQQVVAVEVDEAPVVDGLGADPAWMHATPITTMDRTDGIAITIRAVYTDEELFFLVEFFDDTENRAHKTLLWSDDQEAYRIGPRREDAFVFKWNMEPSPVDLRLSADRPYVADVWFWKAGRTDPVGYADDKMHLYDQQPDDRARKMYSESGRLFYLHRPGDAGKSAYESRTYATYDGDEVPRYRHRQPEGSRADVRAKGRWHDGRWTVEFGRKLVTGHLDDIQFRADMRYQFGVSRREIAGKKPNPSLEQPTYESGEVGEQLTLAFR